MDAIPCSAALTPLPEPSRPALSGSETTSEIPRDASRTQPTLPLPARISRKTTGTPTSAMPAVLNMTVGASANTNSCRIAVQYLSGGTCQITAASSGVT